MTCHPSFYVACAIWCMAMVTTSATADPPELMQWQRNIEEEQISEALNAGRFEEAFTRAKELVQEYRKAQDRPRTRGGISRTEALPRLIDLKFLLARTARIYGDQNYARAIFEELDEKLCTVEQELMKVAQATQFKEEMFSAALLRAIDDQQTTRTTTRITRSRSGITRQTESRQGNQADLLVASAGLSQANEQNASAQNALARAVHLHATLYDDFGSLQLDAGKNRHAETLFRKSSLYWSYFAGVSSGSSKVYRKHLRNYARLYTKDAERFLSEGTTGEADVALDRADSYLKRAREHLGNSPTSTTPSGGSGTSTAPPEPDDWEMADLRYNSGEYNVARSDQCGANDPTAAFVYLDLAETDVLRALDILVELVPAGHPFLAFCFLELSGINARRVLYSSATGVPDCTSRSYARDMRAYWKRTQDIVSKTVQHKDNPVYRMLDAEKIVCKKAQMIAKQFDDADCTGDAVADTEDESSAEPFPHIGSKVRRGPDWDRLWADPDGGEGEDSIGTIVRFEDDGWIAVKWPKTGRTTVHRPGGEGRDDLVDLDGNAVAPRPVATDLSDGQSPFGSPGGGFSGRPGSSGGPMGPGGPPGLSVPTGPSGSFPPGYPSPGGDGTPSGASYPPGLAPVPGSAPPPGYGPPGSPSLPPPGYGPPGTSPSGTPGYGPPGSGSPSSGPPGPTPPGSVPPPSTVPPGSPTPAPQP